MIHNLAAVTITKDHLIAFAAGAIVVFLIMWKMGGSDNSARLRKLERDSIAYMEDKAEQAEKYQRIDSAYQYDMTLLSFRLDSIIHARDRRRPSRIADNDSLVRAIEAELGIVRQRDRQPHP